MDEFGRVVTDLVKDFEMDATCTIKFHVIIIYVREHLENEIKFRPEAPRVECLPNFKNIFKQNGDKPNGSI